MRRHAHLLSYISAKDQLSEILGEVNKNLGGSDVKQVIVLIDESSSQQAESICKQRGIDFRRLATLTEILENIHLIRDADSVRVKMLEDELRRGNV